MPKFLARIGLEQSRVCPSEAAAKAWCERIKARIKAAIAVYDNDIWTSVDQIYETRWDCPTARPAAAN